MNRRLLQINTVATGTSTAAIMTAVDTEARKQGWSTAIAYGRGTIPPGQDTSYYRIGSGLSTALHGLKTRLTDGHGLGSRHATQRLLRFIRQFRPDVIYLHNIHGYYLHFPTLFDFLRRYNGKIIWHLHDCWSLTGHCAFYQSIGCDKWHTGGCDPCPNKHTYPSAWTSRSGQNFTLKQAAFAGLRNLTLVAVSDYLAGEIKKSFLRDYPIVTIRNGVDTGVFKPSAPKRPKTVLGVANIWTHEKGIDDFIRLRQLLPDDYEIILAGRTPNRWMSFRGGKSLIYNNIHLKGYISDSLELAELYSSASVYVSLSRQEGFQTSKIEALACGTAVIGYDICGEAEGFTPEVSTFVPAGDIDAIAKAILANNTSAYHCRRYATAHFDQQRSIDACIALL